MGKTLKGLQYILINEKLIFEIMDAIKYQFIMKKKLFIIELIVLDVTKIEDNANCYTFVWRESIYYKLINLLTQINELFLSYSSFLKFEVMIINVI